MNISSKRKCRSHYVGQAGEYYVLFRLSEVNLLASLAPPGAPYIDIIVSDVSSHLLATVQVKTRSKGRDRGWFLRKKDIQYMSNMHFFVFVDLEYEAGAMPLTYVIPSKVVGKIFELASSKDPKLASYIQEDLFHNSPIREGAVDVRRILPFLRNPPPGFECEWMESEYRNAYWLIWSPLFKHGVREPDDS